MMIVLATVPACGRIWFSSTGVGADADSTGLADGSTVDAPMYALDAGECPPGYTARGTSCYRLVTAPASWLVAEKACEADAVGAHLVVIDDGVEATLIDDNFAGDVWVGTSDRVDEGAYLVVTGGPAPWVDWDGGDPDGDDEDCWFLDSTTEIADRQCVEPNRYLCEFDGVAAQPSTY